MHKIDTPGSDAGSFVDKDPGASVQGTLVDQAWLNAVQEELVNVIQGGFQTLTKGTNTQLLTALKALFAPGEFRAHQASPADMTIVIEGAAVRHGNAVTQVAQQTTTALAVPASTSRIDRIVVDRKTGAYSIIAGVESGTPTAPAIPDSKLPVCQVSLTAGMSQITDSLITDERNFYQFNERKTGYFTDSGAANAYVLSAAGDEPAPTLLLTGQILMFEPANTNTGASTVDVAGIGAKAIQLFDQALVGGELVAGSIVTLRYDGTAFQIVPRQSMPGMLDLFDAGGAANDKLVRALVDAGVLTVKSLNDDLTDRINLLRLDLGLGSAAFGNPTSGVPTTAGVVNVEGYQRDGASVFPARAWVNFDGTGSAAKNNDENVSSITDNGVGNYTVNFSSALPYANYAAKGSCAWGDATNAGHTVRAPGSAASTRTTSALQINVLDYLGALKDSPDISVTVH